MIEGNPINRLKAFVSQDIRGVDEYMINLAKSHVTDLIPDIISYIANSGGKRLRPILTLACAKICRCSTEDHVLLAAAVEFIHTATLLHDDVIDQSKLRRNRKTANNIWGDKASILVGDYLFSQAFKLMVKTSSLEALETLSNAAATIAESEVWQLQLIEQVGITQQDYMNLVTSKTAALFAAACKVGGIAANAEQDIVSAFYEFGLNFGIAFQIIDDLLDYFGNSNEFGKEIGNDFLEGKVTLPIILAFSEACDDEKELLHRSFSGSVRDMTSFAAIIEVLVRQNIFEKIQEVAAFYAQSALSALNNIRELEHVSLLQDIVLYTLRRRV